MCGVAQNHDAPGRPTLELDVFETVVAAFRANAQNQIAQMWKPADPSFGPDRRRCRDLISVKHGHGDIYRIAATRRIEHAATAGPVFDGGATVELLFRRCLVEQETDGTVRQLPPLLQQPDRIAKRRIDAVCGDDKICPYLLPADESQ